MRSLSLVYWLPLLGVFACGYDRGDRYLAKPAVEPLCKVDELRCNGGLEQCAMTSTGLKWQVMDDCPGRGLICSLSLMKCATCEPSQGACMGQTTELCDATGETLMPLGTCDPSLFQVCREGACVSPCSVASQLRSNIGCEYFAVDLDNAKIDDTLNAAAQQFAVVVSNPQPDVPVDVTIEQDDTAVGAKNAPHVIARATISSMNLQVFKLGPREVDGSPEGEFNTGTHTAVTRHAYRIRSTFPVIAYQFNPLENVNVFSNDASLLKPTEALAPAGSDLSPAYVVSGWPQTIANSSDPDTNFNPQNPVNLRAFLTLVGTQSSTHVHLDSTTDILGGGVVPATKKGGGLDFDLDAFDVLNLETDSFNADFTGSVVTTDGPLVVFSGSEASDAPFFDSLSDRKCCADHLEEQLDPLRTAGQEFVATVSPSRTEALVNAGASIGPAEQKEYFRVVAATTAGAHVTTTLSGDFQAFTLPSFGSFATLSSTTHFMLKSDAPVMLSSVSPSQQDANVPTGLPGGDPSLVIIPSTEQFRANYVFLTPDKYNFDFIRIIAKTGAAVALDGQLVTGIDGCKVADADGISDPDQRKAAGPSPYVVYSCQLSFPIIDPNKKAPNNLTAGLQNDGVHRVESNDKVSVIVDGFDSYVSYAYAAGTELEFIVPK